MSNAPLVPNEQAALVSTPDYMANAPSGLEEAVQHSVPSFLKVIQAQTQSDSAKEMKKKYGEGACVVSPENVVVYSQASPMEVHFTPIYFYVEYIKWNALNQSPLILERTTDPKSDLAMTCENAANWKVPVENGGFIRNSKHLNFLVLLQLDGLQEMPILMSFARGTFKIGSNFIKMLRMRSNVPLYGSYYSFSVKEMTAGGNDYYGIVPELPTTYPPVVDELTFKRNLQMHKNFAQLREQGELSAAIDEDDSNIIDVPSNDPAVIPRQNVAVQPVVAPTNTNTSAPMAPTAPTAPPPATEGVETSSNPARY